MLFSKEHLNDLYNWKEDRDSGVFNGRPSRRVFNRWDGNQVLFIINLILENSGVFSIEQGRQIEKLIINELPLEPCSEVTAFNWLRQELINV